MHVRITARGADIEKPETFDTLDARVEPGADLPAGVDRAGSHLWIEPDWIASTVGALAESSDWRASFEEMIVFAQSHGWVDAQGRIRVHLE